MNDLEQMAEELEASGDYHVLRRLTSRHRINEPDGSETKVGICLDVETTGLDASRDEIIELAILPFNFSSDGRIFDISTAWHSLRQPSVPIPAKITAITGIDDAAVAGHQIDPAQVAELIEPALLIIAHHAGFDRPFVERLVPTVKEKCWACSMSEIDWQSEGIESAKLAWLLSEFGMFYERHRAVADCYALLTVLAQTLPHSHVTVLSKLLDAARQPTWRIWAAGSPFEAKDILKGRGYRWSAGDNQFPKSWYIEVGDATKDAELEFLQEHIYHKKVQLAIDRLTAFTRFSERASP